MKTFNPRLPAFLLPGSEEIRKTREYRLAAASVAAEIFVLLVGLGLSWNLMPPQIPVWYSSPWGPDRLSQPLMILLPVLTAPAVFMVNARVAGTYFTSHPLFSRIMLMASAAISAICLFSVIQIIRLVR